MKENMSSYLLTWNPKKGKWSNFAHGILQTKESSYHLEEWSCGNTKSIATGDLIFLMRVSHSDSGIVGFGFSTSIPFIHPHWQEDKAALGKTATSITVAFTKISDTSLISVDELNNKFPNFLWTPQKSGSRIPLEIENYLVSRLSFDTTELASEITKQQLYKEGLIRHITVKNYERNGLARKKCIEHYGVRCFICNFSFDEQYEGMMPEGYIEVHHLKPISSYDEEHYIDPIDDLRPLCANCHRMVHLNKSNNSIDELSQNFDEKHPSISKVKKIKNNNSHRDLILAALSSNMSITEDELRDFIKARSLYSEEEFLMAYKEIIDAYSK
jgi:5-methylcytosine-specific restriction enzyme A